MQTEVFRKALNPRDVLAKVVDCETVVCEFEFQSHNFVHFRTNTLDKGITPFIQHQKCVK